MSEKKNQFEHGGDVYGKNISHDLSVSLNPLGCPGYIMEAVRRACDDCAVYPDLYNRKIKSSIANCYGIETEKTVCGAGVSELLMGLGRMYAGEKIMIPVPSYLGYERAFRECDVSFPVMDEEQDFSFESISDILLGSEYDVLILGSPSNPSGQIIPGGLLYRLLDRCDHDEKTVILDESFAEISDGYDEGEIADLLKEHPCLISLRSVTKSYALPGIRLGYALCAERRVAEELELHLSEWNISPFASAAGVTIFDDPKRGEYLSKSRDTIAKLRKEAEDALDEKGIHYIKSNTCFMMLRPEGYDPIHNNGILLRDLGNLRGISAGWYRASLDIESTLISGKVLL